MATVNTHVMGPIDDDVRDVRVIQKRLQRASAHQIVAERLHELQRRQIPDDDTFVSKSLSNTRQCRLTTVK